MTIKKIAISTALLFVVSAAAYAQSDEPQRSDNVSGWDVQDAADTGSYATTSSSDEGASSSAGSVFDGTSSSSDADLQPAGMVITPNQ